MSTEQNRRFAQIVLRAIEAGKAAGARVNPAPMVVCDGFTNRTIAVVSEGVCGFAWVSFAGNTAFGRWAKMQPWCGKHYPKGLSYRVSEFNQSMTRKEAFANAFAKVLWAEGIECNSGSRMD